jgi:hypothetical protein
VASLTDRSEGSTWTLVLGTVGVMVFGWLLTGGDTLVPVFSMIGIEGLASRLLVSGAIAVLFGGVFGFAFPRWWYLVPIAGSSLDLALMARDFAEGRGNLWPIAVGIRVVWIALAFAGAFGGRLARSRYRGRAERPAALG